MGLSPIIRQCRYIVFQNHRRNNPGGVRGLQLPCKRSRYSNRAISNKAHRVVKEVVYEAINLLPGDYQMPYIVQRLGE